MLIPFIDCKLNKRCPRLGMQGLCVHTLVQTQWQFYLHIDEEMCLNLKPIFENNASLHQIYTHKIVHSSAMYYYNLNVVRKGSKKLLTIKNSKTFFYHLVYIHVHACYKLGKTVQPCTVEVQFDLECEGHWPVVVYLYMQVHKSLPRLCILHYAHCTGPH